MVKGLAVTLAAAVVLGSGCAATDSVYGPYERAPQPQRVPPPPPRPPVETRLPPQGQPAPPPQGDVLARLPHDEEGLGRGPLGRAGVLQDRAIAAVEIAQQRGEPADPALLAHLRMTRQARDLIATGDGERAADLLERAIAIDDGSGFGYLYLGYLHLAAGRRDQARVFLDRAAALLPPDPALRVELNSLRERAEAGGSRVRA
jgi:tetratricopeptide (TPR) repeat protein